MRDPATRSGPKIQTLAVSVLAASLAAVQCSRLPAPEPVPAAAVESERVRPAAEPARAPAPAGRPALVLDDAGAAWVEAALDRLTLEEKIGQLIGCRFDGNFHNLAGDRMRAFRALVTETRVGAMLLFGGEVYETAALINQFQAWADVPLLIASDFERGVGNQVAGATLFPPLMALGAAGSEDLAYAMGRTTALESRALGVHMTYAPVADVNIDPENPIINTRAAGEDPELVSRLILPFIRGCQDHGLIATAKHFPGHGDTRLDSHSVLPVITADRERLERVELAPFRRAIDAGVMAVMTSHLAVPALDATPGLPATLSPAILTGLLRGEMGFGGLIVTDAMEMGGIVNNFTGNEAALRALSAGVDMLLLPPEPNDVVAYLAEAVRAGRLPAERVDDSARRVLEAKARAGLHLGKFVDAGALASAIAEPASIEQARRAFEAAVTLVKNDGPVLPLPDGKRVALLSLSSDPGDFYAGRAFATALAKRMRGLQVAYADGDSGAETLDEGFAKAAAADVVVVALFSRLTAAKGSADLDPRHVELVNRLAASPGGPPVVVVSFGSPYFLRRMPGIDAYVCMYRSSTETQEIAAAALRGEIDVRGRLPVSIPGLFPAGHGLSLDKVVH